METKVVDGGNALQHKVNFDSGLHVSNTEQKIKDSIKLWLIVPDSRRLLEQEA